VNSLSKSKYFSLSGLSYIVPIYVNSLDIVAVNCYSFISMQKMTSDLFVLGYLRTLFQLSGINRMGRNSEKNREKLIVLN
jgi:hypothetical protein